MARLVCIVVLLAASVMATVLATETAKSSFDMAKFSMSGLCTMLSGFGEKNAFAARVKQIVPDIEKLNASDYKSLVTCLNSAALNAMDMDSTDKDVVSEVQGCLNESKTSSQVKAVMQKLEKTTAPQTRSVQCV